MNDSVIDEKVTVAYPARLIIGEMTIVIEWKSECFVKDEEPHDSNFKTDRETDPLTIPDIEATMAFGMEISECKIGEWFETGTRYARADKIGRGGMARILSAKDEQLGSLVAVKVSTVDSRDGHELFANKAEVLASGGDGIEAPKQP